MKIAFVTDMHFGYRRFEADALAQGREALIAAAREADLLILGGDNFDTPLPRMETIAAVTGILREALEIFHSRGISGVPIFAIHGNHDRRAKGYVHPTELLSQGGFLVNFHNRTVVCEWNGGKVAVSGMGNVPEDMAEESLRQIACRPVPGAFNVFVVHQSFQESAVMNRGEFISFDDLPAGYDLYLCGHVHKPSMSGRVLNPGSTVVTQLREDEAGQRGWLLYDTSSRKAEWKPIASRRLFYVPLEFSGASPEEIRRMVGEEAGRLQKENPGCLVKIVVKGTLAPGLQGSDLRLPEFGEGVFVENSMNAENLKERIAQIKLSRERKLSAKEQGMEILRRKLEGKAILIDELRRIVKKGSVEVLFQPIFYLSPRKLFAYEVLNHGPKQSQLEDPVKLFQSALDYGMFFDLEMMCHRKALKKIGGSIDKKLFIFNVSPYIIESEKFKEIMALYANPKQIIFEITERSEIRDFQAYCQTLNMIKSLGFKISVDDVGSGYSSLGSIAEIDPDYVKIEMSLVRDIDTSPKKQNLVRAIVAFCQQNKIVVIAEGIESEKELKTLMDLGVEAGQGYFLGRPMPELLSDQRDTPYPNKLL